jgi:hypothetical protein
MTSRSGGEAARRVVARSDGQHSQRAVEPQVTEDQDPRGRPRVRATGRARLARLTLALDQGAALEPGALRSATTA